MPRKPLVLLAVAFVLSSCAGPLIKPPAAPAAPRRDALLILPGFGYGRGDGDAFRAVAALAAARGIDVYVATYVTRGGLGSSQEELRRFVREQQLRRYQHVHVFAFIAGAWTLNPMADALPNLTTVVYDRSPFQERAPRVAVENLRLAAWLRYGATIFDVARTPYPPLVSATMRVGLLIETRPTSFIRHHAAQARALGGFTFDCDSFHQRYDDCAYLAMSHDDLYTRFTEIWPDVHAFIRTGAFTPAAARAMPPDIALEGKR